MSLLRLAVNTQRWDLAAHAIVLASARGLLPRGGNEKGKAAQKAAKIKKKR